MALSQSPPPLFKQGLSARLRLIIAVAASIGLIQIDMTLGLLKPLRQGLSMVLYPIEQVLILPRDGLFALIERLSILSNITQKSEELQIRETTSADLMLQVEQLRVENDNLRALLELRKSSKNKTVLAEISHNTKDAFSNRVVIDRGSQHGIAPGHAVINSRGVVGQVIRVSPITSEVALVTDPGLVIPVNLPRTGIRSLISGMGDGQQVDLRYLNVNAEVEVGDLIVTSGLDGLYPPGFPVAKVSRIERSGSGQFLKVASLPLAPVGSLDHVLVILVDQELIPPAPRDLDKPSADHKKIKK